MKLDRIKLRELRRAKKMTGIGLAKAVGISNVTLSKIENGTQAMSNRLLLRVAKALGVEPSAICVDQPADSAALTARIHEILPQLGESERAEVLGLAARLLEHRLRAAPPASGNKPNKEGEAGTKRHSR